MTTLCADRMNASALAVPSTAGVSVPANVIRQELLAVQASLTETWTLGGQYREIRGKLDRARESANVDNWDSYGAKAVDDASYWKAVLFAKLLPPTTPDPEIVVDAQGGVVFEWDEGPRRVFSVTVGGNGQLVYAGLFGASKIYGVEYLDEGVPNRILDQIQRILV